MPIRVRKRRSQRIPAKQSELVRDFKNLQKTEFDPDKITFDNFQTVKNMIHKGKNAEIRTGIEQLITIADTLGIFIYEKDDKNRLIVAVKDGGSNTKIVEVDRITGATTDLITGISGQGTPKIASLRGFLYFVNGTTDIKVFEAPATTKSDIILPNSRIAKDIVTDGQRLWVSTTDGALLFSIVTPDEIPTGGFTQSGTAIARAGVANSNITNFTSLSSVGSIVLATGENLSEVHSTPTFESVTVFPADVPTIKNAYSNLGVSHHEAVLGINGQFYIKPLDGVLYIITPGEPTPIEIRENLQQMDKFQFNLSSLAYDKDRNLLYIACREVSDTNDRIVTYNIQEENFSFYEDLFPKSWAFDKDNIYFLATFGDSIENAFQKLVYTDNGINIDWLVESSDTYSNSIEFFNRTDKLFLNAEVSEDIDVLTEIFTDKKVGGTKDSTDSVVFNIKEVSSPFDTMPSYFGLGVFGGSGFSFSEENVSEFYEINSKIRADYLRASMRISGSSSNKFKLRGMGFYQSATNRQVRNIVMS